jgi:hypothetical protein
MIRCLISSKGSEPACLEPRANQISSLRSAVALIRGTVDWDASVAFVSEYRQICQSPKIVGAAPGLESVVDEFESRPVK